MPRKKIAAGQQESLGVAQKPLPFYYEYITPDGDSVLLDHYEWSRGLDHSSKDVKKAQAARKREVKKSYAYTKEA